MNLAEFSIKNQVLSVIVILLMIGGGWTAYQGMPRFEDPEFLIRTAQIIAQYPGANPVEVTEEVSRTESYHLPEEITFFVLVYSSLVHIIRRVTIRIFCIQL